MSTARTIRRKEIQKARRWVRRRARGHVEPYPLDDIRPLEIVLERAGLRWEGYPVRHARKVFAPLKPPDGCTAAEAKAAVKSVAASRS
jgi:hypothetical protein